MIGNISKKKSGGGDFYTKAAVDRKITDAENEAKEYVNNTVKEKLEDANTKLDTKVDKVSGKGLIDSTFAQNIDEKKICLDSGQGDEGVLVKPNLVSLSESAGASTQIKGNKISMSGSDGTSTIEQNQISVANDIIGSSTEITPGEVQLLTTTYTDDGEEVLTMHKLTDKADKSDLEKKVDKVEGKSLIDKQAAELISGDPQTLRVHGDILTSEGEVIVMTPPTDEGSDPIEHKLSEKANMSNSSGGFAAGEGAYAYGTKEVASGEIGLLGMTDLNAIQLGTGINGQEFSVQVYDYVLVVSGEERGKKSATDGKKYIKDVGKLSDLETTDKSSIVAAINEVKSSGGGDVLDKLTYDSTNEIINSDANLLLVNTNSVAAYNGTFRGDIRVGQLGENKWAYIISPTTGFSTSLEVTCTSGNKVHSLANKADASDVITKTNTTAFTPTADYQPATKKYVDDAIAALRADLGLE